MNYCTNCGNQLKHGAKFCVNCGIQLGKPQSTSIKKNNKSTLIIATALIACAVIGIAIWFAFNNDTPDSVVFEMPSIEENDIDTLKNNDPTATPAPTPTTLHTEKSRANQPDNMSIATDEQWMQLYFDKMQAAIAYANDGFYGDSDSEEDYNPGCPAILSNNLDGFGFPSDADTSELFCHYPLHLDSFMLVDLNFDGIPELLIYGDGAGDFPIVRVFTINENEVEMIYIGQITDAGYAFDDEVFDNNLSLYQKASDGSFAFILADGGHMYSEFWFDILLVNSETRMDCNFINASQIAKVSGVADDYYEWSLFFDDIEMNTTEYDANIRSLFAEYDVIPYTPHILWWTYREDSHSSIIDNALWEFLHEFTDR
ncbi:MAG: zinc-ribbon domain-containing protein [Oscillospiraceae bacterium]|jgi:hypothetical protein|nr:zinc-ribbon domain-containing protein [Oscillospiraceae bacterium]